MHGSFQRQEHPRSRHGMLGSGITSRTPARILEATRDDTEYPCELALHLYLLTNGRLSRKLVKYPAPGIDSTPARLIIQ